MSLKDITNDRCKSLDRRDQNTCYGIWVESGKGKVIGQRLLGDVRP